MFGGATISDNPVYERLVANLARPERNITGVGAEADPGMNGKRLQLLKEVAPKASRIALISTNSPAGIPLWRPETQAAARALGLTLTLVGIDTVEQFEPAFAVLERDRPHGLLVADSSANYSHPRLIADFAARQKIPALYFRREFVDAGGLMSYGANFSDQMHRVAALVDKILKGAKPGDLPFELPTKLELVINSKAAKALGITLPQSLLLSADEVIQ
jgi:putative ABC transport system substrate-binding protein